MAAGQTLTLVIARAPKPYGRPLDASGLGSVPAGRPVELIPIQIIFIRKPCFRARFRARHVIGSTTNGDNAVTNLRTLALSAVVATAAFGLLSYSASAQQAPAPAAAPAVTKPATPPPAAKTPAAATAAKPVAKPSPCKGLDETACKAKAECSYVVPTAANPTTGKVPAPYCRKTAGVAVKKPAVAKTAAPAAAAAAKPATPPAAAPKQ